MAYALPLVLAVLVTGSQWVTNPEDLGRQFGRAQALLGGGDFAGARQAYQRVLAVPDGRLLRASRVQVTIDEHEVGLQAVARYQLANLARRQAQVWQREVGLADSAGADSLRKLATAGLREAAAGFAGLRDEPGFELAETAGYLVVECLYEAGDYAAAAVAAQVLLDRFPDGRYAQRARYTLGWAQYESKEYAAAAATFQAYLAEDSTSIRADRARLQTGLALEALGQRQEALAAFTVLAESLDPAGLTVAEQTEVELAGLREGQSRRALVARAWIKRGDLLAALDRPQEALTAYRQVTERFVQEEELAEAAWVRQALLAQQTDGVEAAVAVYRYGSEQATRPGFRARLQAGLMTLLFEQGRYAEAAAAHRLYLAAYADQTEEAGVSVDEARFRLAESLRLQAESTAGDSALVLRREAVDLYGQVHRESAGYLAPEAGYWQGVTLEALAQPDSARAAYTAVVQAQPSGEAACQATLSLVRLSAEVPDTLYAQVLERCRENPEAHAAAALELARRQRQAGQPAAAQRLLEQVPAAPSRYWLPAQLELAQLLLQTGQAGLARERLTALLAQVTEDSLRAPLAAQLGLLAQQQGDHARALELLRSALPWLGGEQRATARFSVGWSLLQQGQYRDAWELWQTALATDTLTVAQRRACLRGLGVCARELGEPARVLALYRQLVEDPATRAEGLLGLGQYWLDQGDAAQAEPPLRDLLAQAEPELAARAGLLLGRALLAQDQPQAAGPVLREGLARATDPELKAEYQFELGSAALGTRAYAEAATAFAAARDQTDRPLLQASALYYQGQSQQAAGDPAAARQTYAALVDRHPESPQAAEAALLLGEQEYEREAYPAALAWYEKVYQRWPASPQAPEALYGAAWCCLEQGQESRMSALFLRLAQEHPRHDRALQGLLHLGDYYYNEQKFAKASQLYTELVARFPETQEALQAHQLLVGLSDVEADSLYQQAMRRYDAEEFEVAVDLLQQVVDRYPGTPSEAAARCNIGMAWQQQQHFERAIQVYEQTITALRDRADEWRALAFARENRDWIYQKILRREPPPLLLATP